MAIGIQKSALLLLNMGTKLWLSNLLKNEGFTLFWKIGIKPYAHKLLIYKPSKNL